MSNHEPLQLQMKSTTSKSSLNFPLNDDGPHTNIELPASTSKEMQAQDLADSDASIESVSVSLAIENQPISQVY